MTTQSAFLVATLAVVAAQADPVNVRDVRLVEDQRTGIRMVVGRVELPSLGVWELPQDVGVDGAVHQVVLRPPPVVWKALEGERMGRLRDRRAVEEGRGQLHQLYWACRQYADQHDGRSPARWADFNAQFGMASDRGFQDRYVLVPEVTLRPRGRPDTEQGERNPLAFEVRPALDDGQHWVLWSDGRVERRVVDAEWVARYGLVIRPVGPTREAELAGLGEWVTYDLYALWSRGGEHVISLTLTNRTTGRAVECAWALGQATPGDPGLVREWAEQRAAHWQALNDAHPSLALSLWLQQGQSLYGLPPVPPAGGGRGSQTTLFNVIGGRAAIRETLQMQNLAVRPGGDPPGERSVSVETIHGVEVKAHPYEVLLGGRSGGRLSLADLVPHDRFLAYFPRPETVVGFLDSGSEFLFQLSSGFHGRSIRYGLLERYLGRMGLTEDSMRALLESGALSEVGLFLPDLFLIDGTDVTVVARLKDPALAAPVLKLMGLGDDDGITVLRGTGHQPVYWARREAWLLISTQRAELEAALSLQSQQGKGSLGQSAEFRAMLLELPVRETTRGYLYFSDPFIRRLTGPAVKIGQLRRVLARGQMEAASAGALLYCLDHRQAVNDLEELVSSGYVPRILGDLSDLRLNSDLQAMSDRYGTPSAMTTLLKLPLNQIAPDEVRAYEQYRENYTRFWRQFFDPIAVRFDQTGPGTLALETFILPLIDSSIYGAFRERIATAETGLALRVPTLDPEPVMMLSANLTDSTWMEWMNDMDDWLLQFVGLREDVLDRLGPAVHLALADADPIINAGSGDLLAGVGASGRGMGNEMFAIPAVISLLTRPASLLVEVRDPEVLRDALRRLPKGELPRQRGFLGLQSALYQRADRDEWIYTLSLEGILKLRYGISLQGGYLVISNLPLTHRPTVRGTREAANNGMALQVAPRAAEILLPSLYAATMERQRMAAMEGVSMLYPIVASGWASGDASAEVHERLFGFAPVHPPEGRFAMEHGTLASSRFGRPGQERQPDYRPGDREFGVFQRVEWMELSAQFEREGLRARCGWSVR